MRPLVPVILLLAFLPLPVTAQLEEAVTVKRVLVDVRVSLGGLLSRDLGPEDFEVTIGRKRAEVESATFVDDTPRTTEARHVRLPDGSIIKGDPPPGRLLIVFIQTDFARSPSRMEGQMKFLLFGEELLRELKPQDRVAVFSFDSHLKFRLDFTADKAKVVEAMADSLRIDFPDPPPAVPEPSLALRLDRQRMRDAATSETALRILAEALREIPGQKTVLLLGWGLGELKGGRRVGMRWNWAETRRALDAARVVVHVLDTTYADYHDLELGLKRVAKETGGIYSKTHVHPQISIMQVRGMIAGHYELELQRPPRLRAGAHDLRVRVKRKGAVVFAPSVIQLSE